MKSNNTVAKLFSSVFAITVVAGAMALNGQIVQQVGDVEPETTSAALMSGCSSESVNWFADTAKRLTRCIDPATSTTNQKTSGKVGTTPIGICDVNRDGIYEFFDNLGQVQISWNPTVILLQSTSEPSSDGSTLLVHKPIFTVNYKMHDQLYAMAGVNPYSGNWVYLTPTGWRDIDGDGDQDLVCELTWNTQGTASQGTISHGFDVWLENTGYQSAPPPNPYDLNQDGHVDSADIGNLLLHFD